MPQPIIAMQLGNECLRTYVFIDFGADGNTISYELFTQLKNIELRETRVVFWSYIGHTVKALGMCSIQLCVSELICRDKFFITKEKLQDVPIILKHSWQKKYNCFFDWQCRLAHSQSANDHLWCHYINQRRAMLKV